MDNPKSDTRAVAGAPAVASGNGQQDLNETNPWSSAESLLDSTFETATASARESHARWENSVAELFAEWRTLLAELTKRHAALTEKLAARRTEGEALPRQVIGDYRRATAKEILQPLLGVAATNRPPVDVSQRFRALLDSVSSLPEKFPENVRLLEPPELYARKEDDPSGVQIRKRLHRIRLVNADAAYRIRSVVDKVFRRPVRPRQPTSRVVHARHLAHYHLRQQLSDRLIDEHMSAHRALATLTEHLERVVRTWANGVLIIARESEPDAVAAGQRIPWDLVPQPPASPEPSETELPEGAAESSRSGVRPPDAAPQPSDEEALEEDKKEESAPTRFDRLFEEAKDLQTGLEQALERAVPPEWSSSDLLEDVFRRFRKDLNEAGTLLLSMSKRTLTAESTADRALRQGEVRWVAWYREFDQRMRYYMHLMKLREKLLSLEQALVRRVGKATVEPVLTTFADMSARLEDTREVVSKHADEARRKADPALLAKNLGEATEELVGFVQGVFSHLPGLVSADQVLSDPARVEWDDLSRFVQSLPEKISMHSLQSDQSAVDSSRHVEIEIREMVAEVLEPPLPDRLRRPAEQLRAAVRRVWTETEQVQHIVQYNLDAAVDELTEVATQVEPATTSDSSEEDAPQGPVELIDSATKLVVEGLARAGMTLSQLSSTLRPSWSTFVESVNAEFRQDWIDVHRRLYTADTAEEQWAGIRSQLGRRVEKARDRVRSGWQVVWSGIVRVATLGRRRAESLIRIGQTAVGVIDAAETTRYDTIDALSSVETLQKNLPLIYRRLFSFEPLDETSLLEGRARDLVWIKKHFSRWENAHQMGVLLIQAPLGSGRTTFLNALSDTVFSEYDLRQINLKERIYQPDDFAALIAPEVGVDEQDITLDRLEEILVHTKRSDPPQVCLIDNLEHLVLRAAQGVATIERIILFLSRTDRSIYWIGTVGTYTWQFLSKTAGTAVGFVDSYLLTPLDRSTIESLIINRHRRSGMTLQFVEPDEASAILRQRLKRAKSPEQRQALSREEYFDRLWRSSGQNVMLALLHWIRSARFSEDNTTLQVQPLRPLRFDYLGDLPLDHAFTLKAFFLHKTLSLSDHSRVFNMSDAESTAILESLINNYIIEEVPVAERHAGQDYHVKRDAIYRLRPLLIHPVTVFLQSKNIVY